MSDTSSTTACPDAATLRALLDGTLPDDQQATMQTHVDRCPACEAALRQMTAGGESWIGMAEKLKGGSEDDPNLAAALDRLKADDSSGGEPSEAADPQRTLDFLQPADDPKLLGKLGRHEISEVIGWGGMGVVLKAYDPSLHRVVAVKVLASHLAHHAVARKRFIREAQAAAAVCHDNVVTIHAIEDGLSGTALAAGVGDQTYSGSPAASAVPLTKGTLPKIIMQFVAGGSLQERIDQEAPLELKEILRIAMQTAAGLAAAHAQGVVHRDVKPANILLENGVQRVKLTDFGLARVMDDASLTLSGVIAGTPQYMAPEQAWGRDVDARADLFSLGAVMYAMCSGHSPFRARTTMAVLKRVCEDPPRPLRAINPDVPGWLVAIIEKLLAKKPEDRFQSATEVSELLGRWLAHVQQPNVVERPPLVGQVFNLPGQKHAENRRDGQVENLSHVHAAQGRLSFKQTHWPVLITVAALSVCLFLVFTETGTRNLSGFVGFCLVHLALTFALCSAFYSAWNTSNWLVWAGATLFLPVSGICALWTTPSRPLAPALLGGEQALLAFGFLFGLLFIRPLFIPGSGKWMSERLTGWQQLFAIACFTIACFTIVGMPLVFLLMYELSYSPRVVPMTSEPGPLQKTYVFPVDPLTNPDRRPNGFPKPTLLGQRNIEPDAGAFPGATAKAAMIPDSLKALLGRWVVVSSEGAQLSSLPAVPISNSPAGSAGGMVAGSGGASPLGDFGPAMGGMMGAGASETSPLQWIEFAEDHVLAFDGREGRLLAEFTEDAEPKRIILRLRTVPLSPGSAGNLDWRYGIFRVEQDRLIVCWTAPSPVSAVPTEFVTNTSGSQLLVLRREWNPGPEFHPRETPPPRAVIPFTAREGKLLQDAWAGAADVAVETTNSLGMKLRLIPPGAFDPVGTETLSKFPMKQIGASFSQPIYLATTEVTVAQFRKFVEATRYATTAEQLPPESNPEQRTWRSPGIVQDSDEHPVVHVSWQDVQAFCRWLSDIEQQQYRLPTIAEWAFAARAGMASTSPLKPPHNARLRFFDKTAPVGGDTANLFGLHNLFGNVSEWANNYMGADEQYSFFPVNEHKLRNYPKVALGGGYQSHRKRDDGPEWTLAVLHIESGHQSDIGFRVARVVTHEVETLSGYWPPVEMLIATATHAGVPVRTTDAKTPLNDSDQIPTTQLPVVSLRGVVPTGAFPLAVKFVDFEIERATRPIKNLDLDEPAFAEDSKIPHDAGKKLDLKFSQEILKRVGFNEGDWVHALQRDPAFTIPSPKFQPPWAKVLVVHPSLPVTPPKSKYEVRHQLFRAFDFEVTPGNSYAYRVRLKFTPAGKHEPPQVIATPWSNHSAWVAVEELREAKER